LKHKLLLLNVTLLAFLGYAGWHLRNARLAQKAREAAELNKKVKPLPPPPFTALPPTPPVSPATYADIAQNTLFDKSRNPTVVVETAPPPPPKPMPPLPVYFGQMNIGSGPMAILSETPRSSQQSVHIGEPIGQFKLVDVNSIDIALEWEGKTIRKNVDELVDHSALAQTNAPSARTEQPAAPPPPVAKSAIGPGADTGRGFKTCDPNDNMPEGSVVDGFRKVIIPTPFGNACRWDPVGR
jgi:hypothetical protein